MSLFLTSVLPFLGHDHASTAAFLTCRHHNFHASIIPEFLSSEERVDHFCRARQNNKLNADKEKQYSNLYNLFVRTPLMQFSPSLVLCQEDSAESILEPLLETKYFRRTLQRCTVECDLTNDLLQCLSKVQSLTTLDLGHSVVENQHLELIINSFPSLETLTIRIARQLKTADPETAINISSGALYLRSSFLDHGSAIIKCSPEPPPATTKTLRNLTLKSVNGLFATQFVPHFCNLRKLVLSGSRELDLLPLSSSLPLLTDLRLENFDLQNTDAIKNLVHLSSLEFRKFRMFYSLSFLTQDNILPELTTLCIEDCRGLSISSFASLVHAPNLHVLKVNSGVFNNDCLNYLENMTHLRKLCLTAADVVGDSQALKILMQNLFQLEELNLSGCSIGGQGAIAGALYNSDSQLRVLHLSRCHLVDDDLNGIGALKNTVEELDLSGNEKLTSEGLIHCKDLVELKVLVLCSCSIDDLSSLKYLVKLKSLNLLYCDGIDDVAPLKDCLNLEELIICSCNGLSDDSLKVFSEEPNSFPNLRVLDLRTCNKLTVKVFEHLSKNNHLVDQLKELFTWGMAETLLSSPTARDNLCQLKGLQRLNGIFFGISKSERNKLNGELMQRLKNLEGVY